MARGKKAGDGHQGSRVLLEQRLFWDKGRAGKFFAVFRDPDGNLLGEVPLIYVVSDQEVFMSVEFHKE